MTKKKKERESEETPHITEIRVKGFKCFRDEARVEIRPLTLLAGANSSGKSSMIQPLLLMKQTLLESHNLGTVPLMISGLNVTFSLFEQLFWQSRDSTRNETITIGLSKGKDIDLDITYFISDNKFLIKEQKLRFENEIALLRPGMSQSEVEKQLTRVKNYNLYNKIFSDAVISKLSQLDESTKHELKIEPNDIIDIKQEMSVAPWKCWIDIYWFTETYKNGSLINSKYNNSLLDDSNFPNIIQDLIHLPGFRGSPERSFPRAAVYGSFPGYFHVYVASIIRYWEQQDTKSIRKLGEFLLTLNISDRVFAIDKDDTKTELFIRRIYNTPEVTDLVSIADVGFGVSQALPVLVALIVAKPGQIVYIEQPELHLHPRAQYNMGAILAEAANRGVIVIAETHSDLLLLGVQQQVASKHLDPSKVKLHWFERDEDGASHVSSTDLDETGKFTFSEWPEDLSETSMLAQKEFLDASFGWNN